VGKVQKTKGFKGRIPMVPEADFNAILALLLKWLPVPFV
jgi:hypothetical protein